MISSLSSRQAKTPTRLIWIWENGNNLASVVGMGMNEAALESSLYYL
jgi:hypothetical protein